MSAIFHHAMQYEWVERKHTSIEHEQAGSTEQGCEDDGSNLGEMKDEKHSQNGR
jgi:hypothetical protein